jgi:hypothetical protein
MIKRLGFLILTAVFILSGNKLVVASEHEKGSMMEGHKGSGYEQKMYSDDDISSVMKDHIDKNSETTGTFIIEDSKEGKVRNFSFLEFHKNVKKKGDVYTACIDFKDVDTGEVFDVDLDVKEVEGSLGVVDVRVHKPVVKEGMKGSDMHEMKGSMHELKGSGYGHEDY